MHRGKKLGLAIAGAAATLSTLSVGLVAPANAAPVTPAHSTQATSDLVAKPAALATINRKGVMNRARYWYNHNVQYGSAPYPGPGGKMKFRTDCSGFVSMAWMIGTSATTWTLPNYGKQIAFANLKSGDALTYPHHHAVLFQSWANAAHTQMYVYEESNPVDNMNHRKANLSEFKGQGYIAIRRNNIVD